ncbi:Lipooligosaccharide biosynthesis protein lex-1, partial [Haemophilus influenzae]
TKETEIIKNSDYERVV